MTTDDTSAQITQLQQQQSLFTQALAAAIQGKWTGEGSVEAYVYALNPHLTGTLVVDPPITESDIPPPKG
jgi:hypothetical protein